jgi:hypothetical protein
VVAAQRYPDAPERQDADVAAYWEPVGTADAELVVTVTIVTTARSGSPGRSAWPDIPSRGVVWPAPGSRQLQSWHR